MKLVEVTPPEFDVDFHIAYATSNNFTGKPVYSRPGCYLHPDAAKCLSKAVELAARLGLRLRIFDAFRPSEAQLALWSHTPDPDFLANPDHGSPHSRGVAIDLTLLDERKNALEMGTTFDAFTPLSHHGNTDISPNAQRNRYLLMGIMTTAGWDFYRNEWWHYQLFNSRRYQILGDDSLNEPMMPPRE
ncbi:MAG: D-alanyl-D-alanine dipeptidase [Alphaproteobacteria bacterium MarineAlpha11_Bin1]|nr:MAG: D-alanyl-D-alanine dipeptidase [Alphaproteobacteria bacterium MarineAlpha11_Bin1]|tara:strand:+ start:17318 stop:17881 length:564 start_codon:yes stop_codon:yes gene_type:complete